ncbi:MAG: ParB/RepB/Spo0J family partition protein [Proteobacteria bacterium]|jgi:ParB family chromosome partitioning protein|nr:ParB/RepB/Spo0J family partition protein [Pseudomonadota bacterium]MDA1237839.1 ParB/RepB/Spo0J family partition protein [Pseudomonadota bacterium]
MKKPKKALGRGLSALMGESSFANVLAAESQPVGGLGKSVAIELLKPNQEQPRKSFSKKSLEELSSSIAEKGILQPILVRVYPNKEGLYQIIAGERRWRAAQLARLHEVPVVIGNFTDLEVLEIAIIENIQRVDLNPIEEALGFAQLQSRFNRTQDQLAKAVGKSRSYIANALRLLLLPEIVLEWVQDGTLSVGHARALITTKNPSFLARKVLSQGLSVRETERLVRRQSSETIGRNNIKIKNIEKKPADTLSLERDLSSQLKMKVRIDHSPTSGTGSLVVNYKSLLDLDVLCEILLNKN